MTTAAVPTRDSDVEVVLAGYAAYARGDIAAAVAHLHPQVEWIEPADRAGGGRRVGPQAVAEYLTSARDGWHELRSMPLARRRGDRIVVEHLVEGTRADGTALTTVAADVYTVRDGQVVRMQAYADPADVPGEAVPLES